MAFPTPGVLIWLLLLGYLANALSLPPGSKNRFKPCTYPTSTCMLLICPPSCLPDPPNRGFLGSPSVNDGLQFLGTGNCDCVEFRGEASCRACSVSHSAVVRTGLLGEGSSMAYPFVADEGSIGDCGSSGTSSVQTLALLSL